MPDSDVSGSPATRIVCIYDLAQQRPAKVRPSSRLVSVFEYGRFRRHVEAAEELLPGVVLHQGRASGFRTADQCAPAVATLAVLVLRTPRHDPLLLLDVELAGESTAAGVARFLATTCFDREHIGLAGQPVLDYLAKELGLPEGGSLAFGSNVHQCVFAGGNLGRDLLAATRKGTPDPAVTTIVYRDRVGPDPGGQLGIRCPEGLNNPGTALAAHGRGVSLFAGWSPPIQNLLALVATTIVAALAVLRRARGLAFEALKLSEEPRLTSTGDPRSVVTEMADRLTEVQLDLSFGVEAYVDTVMIPENLVDSFQTSMRTVTNLDTGLTNTTRMVDRLAAVISARAAAMDAEAQAEQERAQQEQERRSRALNQEQERRSRGFNLALGVVSLYAVPPTLLLAFFGVSTGDVSQNASILDLGRYWPAYVLAYLPLTVLVLTLLGRRLRARSVGGAEPRP